MLIVDSDHSFSTFTNVLWTVVVITSASWPVIRSHNVSEVLEGSVHELSAISCNFIAIEACMNLSTAVDVIVIITVIVFSCCLHTAFPARI